MKKIILITALIGLSLAGMAQTKKEYAQPDPQKVYLFTLKLPASKLIELSQLLQIGGGAIMDTGIPANQVKSITNNSVGILNELFSQLRVQVVSDSLSAVKKQPAIKKP